MFLLIPDSVTAESWKQPDIFILGNLVRFGKAGVLPTTGSGRRGDGKSPPMAIAAAPMPGSIHDPKNVVDQESLRMARRERRLLSAGRDSPSSVAATP